MKRLAIAVVLVAFAAGLHAQIRGIPPSVTSMGPDGWHAPRGIPPSVTSLGPNGFGDSCSGPLIPAAMGCTPPITFPGSVDPRLRPPVHIGPRRHGVVFVPVYVPSYQPVIIVQVPPEPEPEEEAPARTIFERRSRVAPVETAATKTVEQEPEPRPEPAPVSDPTPTVLVFRDGHQAEILNFAIVGDTLFAFSGPRARIPLAELDLDATTRLNEERGVDFHVPGPRPRPAGVPQVTVPKTMTSAP